MLGPRKTRVTDDEAEEIVRLRDEDRLSWWRICSQLGRAECTVRLAYERGLTAKAWQEVRRQDEAERRGPARLAAVR